MKCPRCRKIDLKQMKHRDSGATVDACPECQGIWFDQGELNQVLRTAAKELRPPGNSPHQATALCPCCHVPMIAFEYPQTVAVVDMCPDCLGLWLDRGELKEIEAVRESLRQKGELEAYAPVPGVKGAMLRWIDSAIGRLSTFE